MRTTLQFKIVGIVLVITVILFSVLSSTHLRDHRADLEKSYITKGRSIAQALEANIRSKKDLEDKSILFASIQKYIWLNPEILEISVNLPKNGNMTTYVSNMQKKMDHIPDSDNLNSYEKDILISKIIENNKIRILRVITPVHLSGQKQGTYQIDFSLEEVDKLIISEIKKTGMYYISLMILFSLILFFFLKITIIKPLSEINKAVGLIAQGNLKHKVGIKRKDEIGDLASSFNQMILELKKSRNELSNYANKLDTAVKKRTWQLEKAKKRMGDVARERTIELEKTYEELLKKTETVNEVKDQLEQRNKELEWANKEILDLMKARTDFINKAAHDLRTPITPILLLIPSIKNSIRNKETLYDISVIERNAHYLKRIADNLLSFLKSRTGNYNYVFKKLNVYKIIEGVLSTYKEAFKKQKIKLKNNIPEDVLLVNIDEVKITEVIQNVVSNALKFMPKGGTFTVSSKKIDNFINIKFKDTGIGITKKDQSKIFDEFYKSDKSRHVEGAGLGLAICKEILKSHGGKIWAESKGTGKGTTIIIQIPIKK